MGIQHEKLLLFLQQYIKNGAMTKPAAVTRALSTQIFVSHHVYVLLDKFLASICMLHKSIKMAASIALNESNYANHFP